MTEQFLIGTYTKKTSKGIYKVTLDTDQEKITNVELAIPSQKPASPTQRQRSPEDSSQSHTHEHLRR